VEFYSAARLWGGRDPEILSGIIGPTVADIYLLLSSFLCSTHDRKASRVFHSLPSPNLFPTAKHTSGRPVSPQPAMRAPRFFHSFVDTRWQRAVR